MKRQRNYDKKVKLTRILLSDYLALKMLAQNAGVSMAQALHRLIEREEQLPLRVAIPNVVAEVLPNVMAEVSPAVVAGLRVKSNVLLRVTVAKGGSTNGK